MFNMLTFEVDYLFKQSVNPPQIFRICLVVFELHIKYKIKSFVRRCYRARTTLKNHFLLKFQFIKFSKFQNKISIPIFFSYANQIIQLENYVENIIY